MKTKIRFWIMSVIILSLLLIIANCAKDNEVTTVVTIPVVTTSELSEITQTTATSGGVITSDGGEAVTKRGICWSTTLTPTIAENNTDDGIGVGSFTSFITGLTANTTYYIRAYATNIAGTGYGNVISFTTIEGNNSDVVFNPNIVYGTMTDIDGNTYRTVTIGTQTWMAENLKVSTYNDGTAIPNVTGNTAWSTLTSGALCDFENTPPNSDIYGKLYNWYAVNTNKLGPTGWHIPTDAEWTELTDYLVGETVAGGKLKEIGATHWFTPNVGATNETGFTALPGGYRHVYGLFEHKGINGRWWTASEYNADKAWSRSMDYINNSVFSYTDFKQWGFSVRLVKD